MLILIIERLLLIGQQLLLELQMLIYPGCAPQQDSKPQEKAPTGLPWRGFLLSAPEVSA